MLIWPLKIWAAVRPSRFNDVTPLTLKAMAIGLKDRQGNSYSVRNDGTHNAQVTPLYIILAILVGSELFGLIGTFLAVPIAAMLRVLREQLLPMPVSPRDESAGAQ